MLLEWLIKTLNKNDNDTYSLTYSNDEVGDNEGKSIAEALKENTSLQILSLRFRNIGNEGREAIATALENNYSITKVYIEGLDLSNIMEINISFANKIAEIIKAKIEGRVDALSIFISPNASSEAFYKEVYELGINFEDIQKLNKGGYSSLRRTLIEIDEEQCDEIIRSLKNVEHLIYLRDVVLCGYKFPIAAFKAVALKSPEAETGLQFFHIGYDYNVLKIACRDALKQDGHIIRRLLDSSQAQIQR